MSSDKRYMGGIGCSQEDHIPNCSHFGMSGAYLSEHAKGCEEGRTGPCTCNPTARTKANKEDRDEQR